MLQSDAELVACVRGGDVEAFGRLIGRYERTLLAAALTKLHDIHTAEDVVQATLLLAFQRLETLRNDDKFGPWLMQIARRQVVETVRRQIPVSIPQDDTDFARTDNENVQTWIENEHLLSLLNRLPEHERMLIALRFFDGHSMAEIAAVTARPVGTVTKQISRAIARLRRWCDKENLP